MKIDYVNESGNKIVQRFQINIYKDMIFLFSLSKFVRKLKISEMWKFAKYNFIYF